MHQWQGELVAPCQRLTSAEEIIHRYADLSQHCQPYDIAEQAMAIDCIRFNCHWRALQCSDDVRSVKGPEANPPYTPAVNLLLQQEGKVS
jgi:hypothetical protein